MGRGWRVGLSSSPKLVGVATAAVLIIALLVTSRVLNSGDRLGRPTSPAGSGPASTQAPYNLGGKAQCPPDWPLLAMANHRSYPAGHPAKPPAAATAVACYQTAAKATRAGYRPASLPVGVLEVGGVYLTPTSRGFRTGCQQVADRLGFAVPCPGLLPTLPPGLPVPRLCGEGTSCRRGALVGFSLDGFVVPTDYHGAPGMQPYGALAVHAAATAETADRLGCPQEQRTGTPTVHQIGAVLATCPSPQGPSVLLRWSEQGTFVVLAVLGASQVNQRLIIVLADHLRLIPPQR